MDPLAAFTGYGWPFLGLIVAIGAVTMAVLQLVVDLSPLRWRFHEYRVRHWLDERLHQHKHLLQHTYVGAQLRAERQDIAGRLSDTDTDTDKVFAQLVAQSIGGYSRSFGLPPAQLVAQINAAAQAALENPQDNFSLLAALSLPAQPRRPQLRQTELIPADQHLRDLERVFDDSSKILTSDGPPPKEYLAARTRLADRIQRNLDGMQIMLTNDSALANQIAALMIAVVIAFLIGGFEGWLTGWKPAIITLLMGVAAGYVAPVLGDVVLAIRKLGQP